MGYVSQGERVVGKLEGIIRQLFGVAYMEDGSFVFDVMALARAECTKFWWLWECSLELKMMVLQTLYKESGMAYFACFYFF